MARTQDRIDGDYTIVSTDRPEWARGQHTMAAVGMAWAAGCSVAIAVGVWNGDAEESLLISGKGHAAVGRAVAAAFRQDAYLSVGDGKATLWLTDGAGSYRQGDVFTRQLERAGQPNYTQLAGGRQFVFAP